MSTIITRNSANSGSVPSSLVQGELAINVTDGRLFYGSGSGNVVKEFTTVSASYALTASYVNPLNQNVLINGNLNVTSSFTASGLNYPAVDNGEESFMQTDGNGNLSLQYVKTIYEEIVNGESTNLIKGTPVYVSGSVGAAAKVFRADPLNPAKMPAVYISADTLAPGDPGRGIALGLIKGVDTTGFPAGTEIYLAPGGGWTSTRPTGSAIVQVLGYVTKEGSGGQGVVLNPGPATLPNLPSGSVWVGNSSSVPVAVATSSLSVLSAVSASYVSGSVVAPGSTTQVVFNNGGVLGANSGFVYSGSNVGIGTSTPSATLDIKAQGTSTSPEFRLRNSLDTVTLAEIDGRGTYIQRSNLFTGSYTVNFSANNQLDFTHSVIGGFMRVGPANTINFLAQRLIGTVRGAQLGSTTIGVPHILNISEIVPQSSGTTNTSGILLNYAINNTGTYVGVTRGIHYNPTLTSLIGTTHIAFENTTGDVLLNTTSGNTGIGLTSPQARLHIRGSGATSATIGLRVENSNASASLIVNDAGDVYNRGAGGVQTTLLFGENAGRNITGADNSGYGFSSLFSNTSGTGNSAFGAYTLQFINSGNNNVVFGYRAGRFIANGTTVLTTSNSSVFIGQMSRPNANSETNQIVIGDNAIGLGSNTSVIGNTSTTLFRPYGNVAINRNSATASLDVAGTTRLSGSFNTATSGSILTVIGSGSAQPLFTVQGSQGELFSVTDSLSGSLFSVNDISGLPILEVFSDNTTLMGSYLDPMLITTTKITQTNSGSFVVYSLPTASYDTAFFEYSIKSGSNARAGTIMAIQAGSTVNFTETTTTDIGDTTAVSFTVLVTGSNIALTGSSTSGAWVTKCIIRGV